MDKLNKQELRRLAEDAQVSTNGDWALYVPEDYQGPSELPGCGIEDSEGRAVVWGALEPETGFQYDEQAKFVAAANPAAILSLLDELEQAEERIAGLEIETLPLSMLRTSYQVHKALVEAAGCETIEQLAEQRDAALAELEQYRKDAERYRRYRLGKVSPELLDAEIDAAMAKEGGANG